MRFNWANHETWCNRMSYEERGLFDAVRSVLWTVVGCKMPLETIKVRLNIKAGSRVDKLLGGLINKGSLSIADGKVFDEIQVAEFSQAVSQGITNKANGSKGGRPKGLTASPQREIAEPEPVKTNNPCDF